jgi:endonuclease-3
VAAAKVKPKAAAARTVESRSATATRKVKGVAEASKSKAKPARVAPESSKPVSKKGAASKPTAPSAAALANAASQAPTTFELLQGAHPDAHCELDHRSPFELLVATVLSAQSTDVAVNQVTPELFRRWPTPKALSAAPAPEVEKVLGRLGMFRQKTKNIVGLSQKLLEKHDGSVPTTLAELVELPGVGRKTANVVLGVAFGHPEGVVVDTHVQRVSQRLGWTTQTTPELIEKDLMARFPNDKWDALSHTLIFHGRRVCSARKPACGGCAVATQCPHAFRAEEVGRKPARRREPPTELASS